jgi:hypothetical protein
MGRDQEMFNEEETARRRDDALHRALITPPKPHQRLGTRAKKSDAAKKAKPNR